MNLANIGIFLFALLLKLFSVVLRVGDLVTEIGGVVPALLNTRTPLSPGKYNTYNLIKAAGYPLEIHGNIVTEDGYILEMQRIPSNNTDKPPCFLLHGLMASSADWLIAGEGKALGFRMADMGYDVWLGNVRGNTYSRKHKVYNPEVHGQHFWNYSFHEIATYDIPVMVDYILNKTGQSDLVAVAHSQGTTSFMAALAEKPEYNDKIRMLNLLAPVAFMNNIESKGAQFIAPYYKELRRFAWDNFQIYEFIQKSIFLETLTKVACFRLSPVKSLCPVFLFSMFGFDPNEYDESLSTRIFSNVPTGSSLKQFLHYAQSIATGHFRHFDYSTLEKDLPAPKDYDISNIKAPVGLHYSKNDLLSAPVDVQRLAAMLPNLVIDNLIPDEKFNHIDFLFAKNINTILYNDLIANITSF